MKTTSAIPVLQVTWLLLCSSLMIYQTIKCTTAFLSSPTVTNIAFERFSDDHLPSITVCPVPEFSSGVLNAKTSILEAAGLTFSDYFYNSDNFTWAPRNGSQTAAQLQDSMAWQVEDLLAGLSWYEVDSDFQQVDIADIKQHWHPANWNPFNGRCYSLNLAKIKTTSERLKKVTVYGRFAGGLRLYLHLADQAYDPNLATEVEVRARPSLPSHVPSAGFKVTLDMVTTLNTDKQPCTALPFDSELTRVGSVKMMSAAGCVVPWVDRLPGFPVCAGGQEAATAFQQYNRLYNSLGLYERQGARPPCSYTIPRMVRDDGYQPRTDNYTAVATLGFSSQVQSASLLLVCLR